jgi:hypothetical protein
MGNDPGVNAAPGAVGYQLLSTTFDETTGAAVKRLVIRERGVLRNQESCAGDESIFLAGRERSKDARIHRVDQPALKVVGNHRRAESSRVPAIPRDAAS